MGLCNNEEEVSGNQVRFSAAAKRRLESIGGNVGSALNVGGSVQKAGERNSPLVALRALPVPLLASSACVVPFTSPLGLQTCVPPPPMPLTISFAFREFEADDEVVAGKAVVLVVVIPGLLVKEGGLE